MEQNMLASGLKDFLLHFIYAACKCYMVYTSFGIYCIVLYSILYILWYIPQIRNGKQFDIVALIKRQLASWKGTKNQSNSIRGGHSSVADCQESEWRGEGGVPFVFQQLWARRMLQQQQQPERQLVYKSSHIKRNNKRRSRRSANCAAGFHLLRRIE